MAKGILIALAACLMTCTARSQTWTVHCKNLTPFEYTEFEDGFVDEDGIVYLAGRNGNDYEHGAAYVMRIQPDGGTSTYRYEENECLSSLSSIIAMDDERIFVAGNLSDDEDDYIFTMVMDKNLNVLSTHRYAKEVEGIRFGRCTALSDEEGHVIVASSIVREQSIWIENKGVLIKYNDDNHPILQRYLIADYPEPMYFMNRFKVRQMWNQHDGTFLCLAPGSEEIYSFLTFDSDFNLLDEKYIQDEQCDILGHTLSEDCFSDLWTSSEEAIIFSSLGWYDRNKLRAMKINADGEFLEYVHINERNDTIDFVAPFHCMAAANDTTLYFCTSYGTHPGYPGFASIYLLNDRLEITGHHLETDDECLKASMILATQDGGCISIYDSCSFQLNSHDSYPIISKLSRDDFDVIPWSIIENTHATQSFCAYPNPTHESLFIPFQTLDIGHARCQISDITGRIILDCVIDSNSGILHVDVSRLNNGIYNYSLYNNKNILYLGTFLKN